MKRFTFAVVGCALAFGAMAHRDNYFGWQFQQSVSNGQTYELGSRAWSMEGAIADLPDPSGFPILMADGAYSTDRTEAGKCAMVLVHDQRSEGERVMPNLQEVRMSLIAASYTSTTDHALLYVTVEDEYGESVTFNFDVLKNSDIDVQDVVSTSVDGDPSSLGNISRVNVVFDNLDEGEVVSPNLIYLCSSWVMPKVNSGRVVTSTIYNRGPETTQAPPTVIEETGVTYIQAEDWDEPWINNRTTHSATGANGFRLFTTDKDVTIFNETPQNGDGSPYSRWAENHGRVVGNRWADGGSGYVLGDWAPSVNSDLYYRFRGEYKDASSGEITLESAIANYSAFTEYTFEAEEDCDIDISLRIATHRSPFESMRSAAADAYWYDDPSSGGYWISEYPDNTYVQVMGFKYELSVDDQVQRTAWDKAPFYETGMNGGQFIIDSKNPANWSDVTETVDGQKVNSRYLYVFPYAHWADDSDDPNAWGAGWLPFYKTDMLQVSLERGHCSQADFDKFNHADYMNIPVKKGRHTIKVRNCGGNSWFDEIRIQAKNGAGIEGVAVDGGNEDALGGTAVYFDFQGRQVANPSNGIYIVKRGNKVTKEVVR